MEELARILSENVAALEFRELWELRAYLVPIAG